MRKRIIALAMTAVLIVSFVGCNSAVDDVSTNVPTQEITEENNVPESNPTSVPTEIPTSVPTDDSESATQEPTPTLSLEITKIPHSILTSTPKVDKEEIIPTAPIVSDDNNEDKPNKDDIPNFDNGQEATPNPTPQVSEAPKASPTPQISEEPKATSTPIPTQKVEVTPTSTPKPTNTPNSNVTLEPTKAPSNNDSDIIAWEGEVKLDSMDITIPTLSEFNDAALKEKNTWGGKDGVGNLTKITNTLASVNQALDDKGVTNRENQKFLIQDYAITFDWLMKGASSDLELHRDTTNGEFILEINTPLDEDIFFGRDLAPYNRDILLTMVSCISSTPSELVNYIMVGLYEDASILNDMVPQKVGDCQVLIDTNSSYKGHYVFRISE